MSSPEVDITGIKEIEIRHFGSMINIHFLNNLFLVEYGILIYHIKQGNSKLLKRMLLSLGIV